MTGVKVSDEVCRVITFATGTEPQMGQAADKNRYLQQQQQMHPPTVQAQVTKVTAGHSPLPRHAMSESLKLSLPPRGDGERFRSPGDLCRG